MGIRKMGTRKLIAVLTIVALLASYSIALAQGDGDDGLDPDGKQQEELVEDELDEDELDEDELDEDELDEDELDEDELDEDELDEDELDEDELDEEVDDEEVDDGLGGMVLFTQSDFGTMGNDEEDEFVILSNGEGHSIEVGIIEYPSKAQVGQQITVKYEVENTSNGKNNHLYNVEIEDSFGNNATIGTLEKGAKEYYTQNYTIEDTDGSTLTFWVEAKGDKHETNQNPGSVGDYVEVDITITQATEPKPDIEIQITEVEINGEEVDSLDDSIEVEVGDDIEIKYEVTNMGDVELTNIIVSDNIEYEYTYDNQLGIGDNNSFTNSITYNSIDEDFLSDEFGEYIISVNAEYDGENIDDDDGVTFNVETDQEPGNPVTYKLVIDEDNGKYWAKFDDITGDFKSGVQYFEWDPGEVEGQDNINRLPHLKSWGECPLEINAKGGNPEHGGYDTTKTLDCDTKTVTIAGFTFELVDYNGEENKWKFKVTGPGEGPGNKALSHFSFSYTGDPEEPPVDPANPNIKVTKTVDKKVVRAGTEITYTYKVKNTGDVPLTNVQITDKIYYLISEIDDQPVIELVGLGEDNSLDPGQTATGTYTYTPKKAGTLTNVVKATGQYGDITVQNTDIVLVVVLWEIPEAGIMLEKSADVEEARFGETITYTYKVTNIGKQIVYIDKIVDDQLGTIYTGRITDVKRILMPDKTQKFTWEHTVNGEETLDEGCLINTATVSGHWFKMLKKKNIDDTSAPVSVRIISTGSIKVIKTMSDGSDPDEITFILNKYEQRPATRLLIAGEDGWPKTEVTDTNGEILFDNLEPGFYTLEEVVPDGYATDLDPQRQIEVVAGEPTEVKVLNIKEEDELTGKIKVVKTLNGLEGEPHEGVEFKLYRHPKQIYTLALAEGNGWARTGTTDYNGEILFNNLDCDYYYILEEMDMDDYEVRYYLDPDPEGSDECPDIYVNCEDITTIYVVNTKEEGDEPSGGGGGSKSKVKITTTEPVEVPEEPEEVLTPPVEETVEEPVVVEEEPLVTAPELPDLPFTGGNPAAFQMLGAALAGLGLFVRKRR